MLFVPLLLLQRGQLNSGSERACFSKAIVGVNGGYSGGYKFCLPTHYTLEVPVVVLSFIVVFLWCPATGQPFPEMVSSSSALKSQQGFSIKQVLVLNWEKSFLCPTGKRS
ncbi:hypothetical protein CHARACLAT_018916 [Characodon lateralis]|uniref:Uncharacterized protein n=1 Tax=Characodon lateralis TaxID=208331 RepID=A0ABU7E1Q4_9TELE|nr:hypothetical protein [Characodon lateralis]